jgi:DNA repair exonuclease SbcCD ATPase subunit
MKLFSSILFLCTFSARSGAARDDHPISKVITLIKDLKVKAIAEGQSEEVAYEKFQYWCSTSIAELKDAITESKETIDELNDKISGLTKQKAALEKEIESLENQIAELQAGAKKAEQNRDDENALYTKAHEDFSSTIKAIEECIKALQKAETSTEAENPTMLVARMKKLVALIGLRATATQRHALERFAEEPKQLSEGDFEKHVDKYSFKSDNVIELLKELQLKFEDDQLEATKAETNAQNAYELAKQARDNAIAAAEKSKDEKEKALGATEKDLAEANSELESTQKDLEADTKTLEETENACHIKKTEWETRSKTRAQEIEAMDQAVKILSKATGVRDEVPSNPVPPPSPLENQPDFLQISQVTDPKMKAVALLKEAAKVAHSKALERLAIAVAAHLQQAPGTRKQGEAIGMNAFSEVNNMIEQMIFRLMDEQKKENEHKAWCDQELSKTKTMKEDKDDKIAELKGEIDVETAAVQKLTVEIEAATKMIADIVKFMAEATEIRETGKKENALAIKDAQDAQTALTNAIAVLEAFYKESGEIPKEPWEFLQKNQNPVNLGESPSTWDAGYTGVTDPDKQPGGIISVLQAVSADFSKMETETKAQEAEDQQAYEEDMKANKIEKAGREQEVEMKTAEKGRRVEKISSLQSTKKNVEGELEKTEQYLKDLQPACVTGDSDYETRKASRDKEIVALQEAQKILQDAFKEQPEGLVQKGFMKVKRHN